MIPIVPNPSEQLSAPAEAGRTRMGVGQKRPGRVLIAGAS